MYFKYVDINKIKDINRELYYLYNTLQEVHEKLPVDISYDEFVAFFYIKYPDADRRLYDVLFTSMQQANISELAAEELVNKLASKYKALELSELSFKVAQGLVAPEELSSFISTMEHKVDHQTGFKSESTDLDDILVSAIQDEGIRWRLDCLNKSLGSIRKGDFGYIFARPEVGKTAFLASEISNALDQVTKPIIWFNAEEQNAKVILRVYQSYFGVTLEQILANPRKYKELFEYRVGDKLKFYGIERCNKADVEAICAEYEPSLTCYDQLSKFRGFSADRDDLKLGAIFMWARELAKIYGTSIGVHQADGSAEGHRWLTMDHCANAKTAIQAEADWILGIGKVHDMGMENIRFLSICKNKLLGSKDSIPDLRHGRLECLINPAVMRYEDLINYGQ